MTIYTYNATNFDDNVSTYDLQNEYSWVTSGFEVNGLSGDDILNSSFIGRNGVDSINGGDGDDFMSLNSSYLSPLQITNYASFFGGYGTDSVYLTSDDSTSDFIINEYELIQFTVYGTAGEVTQVNVSPTVEIISLGGFYYLTEDIWNGRIRVVDFSEVYARAYNENSDWATYDLDTYTEYHSAATPEPTPAPVPTPTPTPEPEPNSSFEWGSFTKDENLFLEAEVSPGGVYDIYFTVTGSQSTYTYFDLYDFTDDLDLSLYQYSASLEQYEHISVSEEYGTKEESIFKALSPGDYILEISHYEDLDNSDELSSFTIDFNSSSFYENSFLPNDALFASQWHLLNNGQAGGIDNEDISAPEAWKIRSTSPDVVVAVIDEGIQLDHPDLNDNLWINSNEISGNGIDDDNNGYVDDIHGWNFPADSNYPYADINYSHGTHVAGIIGAEGNNGTGATGVTWDTQLMSLDVFNGSEGAYESDIIDAIYYAASNDADVINMSLGASYPYTTIDEWRIIDPNGYSEYYEALSYAVDQGSTVVIAAGNEDAHAGTHLSIPATFSSVIDGVISVAAIDNTGDLTDYTNYGSLVTIAAPGGGHDVGSGILSTVPGDSYEEVSGTSMASPIVAGAAALIKAENPNLTPVDIESIITDSADKYRDMTYLIQDGNYLNLKDALSLAQAYEIAPEPTPTPVPTPTPEPAPTDDPSNFDLLDFANLSPDQVGAFTPEVIQGFDPEQLFELDPEAFEGFTPDQVSAFTPEVIQGFEPEQLFELDPEAFEGFTQEQVGAFTAEVIQGFDPEQLHELAPVAFEGFTPEQVGAFTSEVIQGFEPDQLVSLKPAVFKGFSSNQISAFKPEAFTSFTSQILKKVKPSAMPGLVAEQVTAIADELFGALKPKQLGKMTPEAFRGVDAGQFNALAKKQMKKINDEKVSELNPKMIKGIDAATFAMLKSDAITGFTKQQFRKVSADQLNSLQEDQIQAIDEDAIPGLKKKILKKLDEAAFTSFSPDQLDDFTFKQLKAVDTEYIEVLDNDQQSAISGLIERLL